jgi:hypothetical protein
MIPQTAEKRPSQSTHSSIRPRPGRDVAPSLTSVGIIPEPWQIRSWFAQAARLYARPEAQQLAVMHHLSIIMAETPCPDRWRWAHDLAAHLDDREVAP